MINEAATISESFDNRRIAAPISVAIRLLIEEDGEYEAKPIMLPYRGEGVPDLEALIAIVPTLVSRIRDQRPSCDISEIAANILGVPETSETIACAWTLAFYDRRDGKIVKARLKHAESADTAAFAAAWQLAYRNARPIAQPQAFVDELNSLSLLFAAPDHISIDGPLSAFAAISHALHDLIEPTDYPADTSPASTIARVLELA